MKVPLSLLRVAIAFCSTFMTCLGLQAQTSAQPTKLRAQQIVEAEAARKPGLVAIAMHVTTPSTGKNTVIASTLPSSIGKPSDEDDIAVGISGKPFAEPMPAKSRYEVLVPLLTRTGDRIGSVGVIFPWHTGESTADFMAKAVAIRDEMQPFVLSIADLLTVDDPAFKPRTLAQQLIDQAVAAHPEVIILILRATPPGQAAPVVVASNVGRYGSAAGKDDTRIIATGITGYETDTEKHRYEVEPAFRDAQGRILGSLSIVFSYKEGDDTARLRETARRIHATMSSQVEDNVALFRSLL